MPPIDGTPVRVGVGVIGAVVVLGLFLGARSLNRRPQH
jgi:D-alanyl-D-alanine carboxypeptidase (penicillin-binding protein 5/6)